MSTTDKKLPLAHLTNDAGADRCRLHLLREHLEETAALARRNAAKMDAGDWGYLAGLWHDLGKYSAAFQSYLRAAAGDYHRDEVSETAGRTDHSTAGAQHAHQELGEIVGGILSFVIAGHHAGLLDAIGDGAHASLEHRLSKSVEDWSGAPEELRRPTVLQQDGGKTLQNRLLQSSGPGSSFFGVAFFVRMLFSCLVDADFLDTEQFMSPRRAENRPAWPRDVLQRMDVALTERVDAMRDVHSVVGVARREVYEACIAAASMSPGFFSLTVPTGGGKTLSSLAFALRHALQHNLGRVIYVAPFTSIIEQNADVYRQVFAAIEAQDLLNPVIEHHSAMDADHETVTNRLAAENWDAPLVVTTAVQFYESMFAARPSRCRKLHNLIRSVIVLDEAQKLPVDLLRPTLLALQTLVEQYGATVLLCTATQPAIAAREGFSDGLKNVREIIGDPADLASRMKRVEVRDLGEVDETTLVTRLLEHDQVLCITNTRCAAADCFRALRDRDGDSDSLWHLSAAMCPEHRTAILGEIRRRLEHGHTCRVISTQVVEAGVDIDFPVVYRALAGIDSIAQAAGRCNREGRRPVGTTWIYRLAKRTHEEGFLADTINAATQVLATVDGQDLLSPEIVEQYFRLYFWQEQHRWDRHGIVPELAARGRTRWVFGFQRAAARYRLIADSSTELIIPWGERGWNLVDRLRNESGTPSRQVLRQLQRFIVQLPRRWLEVLLAHGRVEVLDGGFYVLISPESDYDADLGIVLPEDSESWRSEALIV